MDQYALIQVDDEGEAIRCEIFDLLSLAEEFAVSLVMENMEKAPTEEIKQALLEEIQEFGCLEDGAWKISVILVTRHLQDSVK